MYKTNYEVARQPRLRTPLLALGLGMGVLLLAGCGEDRQSGETGIEDASPSVQMAYYDNGTRVATYYDAGGAAQVISFCDGPDLVDQTNFHKVGSGAAGNSVERSVAHPACADGRLTEQDFAVEQ